MNLPLCLLLTIMSAEMLFSQDFNSIFYPIQDANICSYKSDNEISQSNLKKLDPANLINNDSLLIVPTVVHIFHNYDEHNISNEHIKDLIMDLNERYSLRNDDTINIHPDFREIMGNANIEFRLASKDPDGNCTTGILRNENFKECWDLTDTNFKSWYRYLNVFIVPVLEGNLTGVAHHPMYSNGFKPVFLVNTPTVFYSNPGQYTTVIHEIGHLFGLHHTWGPTNETTPSNGCSIDDGIEDTPNQEKANRGSCYDYPHISCPNQPLGDNFNNYMDYTQSCKSMFTVQQTENMRQTLLNNFYLKDLTTIVR